MSRTVTVDINVNADPSNVTRMSSRVADLGDQTAEAENKVSGGFQGMGSAASVALGNVAAEAISRGIEQLKQLAVQSIQTGARFEQSMADVQAITGLTDDKIRQLGQAARETSVETGRSASEVGKAYKLLASNIEGSAGRSVESLRSMGKEVVTLSQAAGVDLKTATDTVAQTINQFGLEAAESGRVVNVLAAGAKEGAAEVGQLSQTLKTAGTSAAGAGVSLEETTAAAEVMAQSGIKGAEAGTALRNVMTILQTESEKLAKHGIKDVNLAQDGLAATMQKLRPLLSDATARTEIFGRENQNAAQVLIQNAQSVDQMTQAVTDTQTAQKQAATQMDTFQGVMKKFNKVLDNLQIALFKAVGPELKSLIKDAKALVQEYQGQFVTFFNVLVEAGPAAVGVLETAFGTFFRNFGDILFNFIQSIPRLVEVYFEGLIEYMRRQLKVIKTAASGIWTAIKGIFTADRSQFKKGLSGIESAFEQTGENIVAVGKETGAKYAQVFSDQVLEGFIAGEESILAQTDFQRSLDRFKNAIDRGKSAGTGMGSGGGGTQQQQGQQGGMAGGNRTPQRVKTAQQIEAAERSLTKTVVQGASKRMQWVNKEKLAAVEAAQRKKKAKEAERQATEKALEQQIASSQQGAKNAEDAAGAMVAQIRKIIQAKIAQTIASAIAPLGPLAPVLGAGIAAGINALFNAVLPSFRTGGEIRGPGGPTDDAVPIMASDREFVINAESAQAAPNTIRKINQDPAAARRIEEQEAGGSTVRTPRSTRRPSRGQSGGSKALQKQLAGVEAAVREQTERMQRQNPVVDVRELDEEVRRFREKETAQGVEVTDAATG